MEPCIDGWVWVMIIQLIFHAKYVILKWICYESTQKIRYWYWQLYLL